jgi:hypothetical protein
MRGEKDKKGDRSNPFIKDQTKPIAKTTMTRQEN